MELINILLLIIIALLVIMVITIYIKINQLLIMAGMDLMDPKKPIPQTKEKHLRYNPADLFNPYKFADEGELDPVVPDNFKPFKKVQPKKNEY